MYLAVANVAGNAKVAAFHKSLLERESTPPPPLNSSLGGGRKRLFLSHELEQFLKQVSLLWNSIKRATLKVNGSSPTPNKAMPMFCVKVLLVDSCVEGSCRNGPRR